MIRCFSMLLALGVTACVGEASVTYKGTVTEAEGDAMATFDAVPNAAALPPIAGARVTLCADCESSPYQETGSSDAVGAWGPFEQVFGGFIGSDTTIRLDINAEGMDPFTYQVIFEDTSDPKNGELYLNVRMKRK